MDEPSQNRIDLSGIHPLKRVTLIVLGFMFGVSLVFTLAKEFAWGSACLDSPRGRFTTTVDRLGLELSVSSPVVASTDFTFQWSHSDNCNLPNPKYPVDQVRKADPRWIADFYPVPGLTFHRVYNRFFSAWIVVINPLWLVGTSSALYLFTRWRIRRTARIRNTPS